MKSFATVVLLSVFSVPAALVAQNGKITAAPEVLFVCEHGAAKSILAAAEFNLNYASYPMTQAVNYREVLEGLDFFVRNACPRAPSEDGGNNSADRRS